MAIVRVYFRLACAADVELDDDDIYADGTADPDAVFNALDEWYTDADNSDIADASQGEFYISDFFEVVE